MELLAGGASLADAALVEALKVASEFGSQFLVAESMRQMLLECPVSGLCASAAGSAPPFFGGAAHAAMKVVPLVGQVFAGGAAGAAVRWLGIVASQRAREASLRIYELLAEKGLEKRGPGCAWAGPSDI